MKKVNVGCGPNLFLDGWINLDREDMASYIAFLRTAKDLSAMPAWQARLAKRLQAGEDLAFRVHDLRNGLPFATSSVDRIYLGQIIEHLNPVYEAPQLLAECYRVLRPGGILRIATPDLDRLVVAYINTLGEKEHGPTQPPNQSLEDFAVEQPPLYRAAPASAKLSYILFGAMGPNSTWDHYEGHMHCFGKDAIERLLRDAGFEKIRFYAPESPRSDDPALAEVIDNGLSHSLIVEATR